MTPPDETAITTDPPTPPCDVAAALLRAREVVVQKHVVLVLEGDDGAGKSTHVQALDEVLARMMPGATATFRHPPPSPELEQSPLARAVWYSQRRAVAGHEFAAEPPGVLLTDRWWWSTLMFGAWRGDLQEVVDAEERAWSHACGVPVLTILLDAPDEVLDARLAERLARGTATRADADRARHARLREAYRDAARARGWPVVDTSGPAHEVARNVLRAALELLVASGCVAAVTEDERPAAPLPSSGDSAGAEEP